MSVTVLLHHPHASQPPVGIWWWSEADKHMRSFYKADETPWQIRGTELLGGVQSPQQFDSWSQVLSDRTPYPDGYERAEINGTMSPQEYLDLIRRHGSR